MSISMISINEESNPKPLGALTPKFMERVDNAFVGNETSPEMESIAMEAFKDSAYFLGIKVKNKGRATLYFLIFFVLTLCLFAVLLMYIEGPAEVAFNREYTSMMAQIKANLTSEAFDELVHLIGIDPVLGLQNFVEFDGVDWATRGFSAFITSFYVTFTMSTTIGYGDVPPLTNGGKIISVFTILVTIPIAVITYVRVADWILVKIMKVFLKQSQVFQTALNKFDTDNNGTLDKEELHGAFGTLGLLISSDDLDLIISKYDADGNGVLDIDEFADAANSLGVEFGPVARDTLKLYFSSFLLGGYTVLFCIISGLALNISAVDSIYYTVVTFTTVGLGDITPQSPGVRGALILPIFVGLGLLALVIQAVTASYNTKPEVQGKKYVAHKKPSNLLTQQSSRLYLRQESPRSEVSQSDFFDVVTSTHEEDDEYTEAII